MATKVAGELYEVTTGQLFEIARQLRQPNGYPFDPQLLKVALQNVIEGKFNKGAGAVFTRLCSVRRDKNASAVYFRELFKEKGIKIETYADQMLEKVDFAEGPDEMDIVHVFVRDLGFKNGSRRSAIYEKALANRWTKIPAWAALNICYRYDHQPNNDWLVAGMEPVPDLKGNSKLFLVIRDENGERRLGSNIGYGDFSWNSDNAYIFAIPRM